MNLLKFMGAAMSIGYTIVVLFIIACMLIFGDFYIMEPNTPFLIFETIMTIFALIFSILFFVEVTKSGNV